MLTAGSVGGQAKEQYRLWQQSCLDENIQEDKDLDDDPVLKTLWATTIAPSLKPIFFEDPQKGLVALLETLGAERGIEFKSYILRSKKGTSFSYKAVLFDDDRLEPEQDEELSIESSFEEREHP